MADEISDSHFTAGNECGIAGEKTDGNQQAENYFDYSCQAKQRTERNWLAAEPAKEFLSAMRNEQKSGNNPQDGVRIWRKRRKSFFYN